MLAPAHPFVESCAALVPCIQGIPDAQLKLLPALLPNTELLQSEGVLDTLRSPGQDCVAHADAVLEVRRAGARRQPWTPSVCSCASFACVQRCASSAVRLMY